MTVEGFKFQLPIPIRWSDHDELGHVNNATFITYFEEARIRYFHNIAWDWAKDGLIVARNEINYLRPLHLGEEPVIFVRCSRIGGKSFDIEYVMLDKDGNKVCDGKTVVVCFDYSTGQSTQIAAHAKEKLENYEL
jgi:acyl-CoA thioester hydrolase